MPFFSSFLRGVLAPVRGAKVISRHPLLIVLSVAPVVLAALLYFFIIVQAQSATMQAMLRLTSEMNSLLLLVRIIAVTLGVIFGALTFSIAVNIIGAPFNDYLAEAAETRLLTKTECPS